VRGHAWIAISFLLAACATRVRSAPAEPPIDEALEAELEELESEDDEPNDVATLPGEHEPVDRVLFGWHAGNWGYLRYFASVMRVVVREATAVVAVESPEEELALRDALADAGVDMTLAK
jgi:hypothetical protein